VIYLVILVTYLPFYRIHEIAEFFVKNIEAIKPERALIFIDNVYHEKQKELALKFLPNYTDYVFGNWGSRNDTWIAMFKRLRQDYHITGDVIFIDSDNVVTEDFLEHHHVLRPYGVYGILDHECWARGAQQFLKRCFTKDREHAIFMYKVYEPKNYFRGGSPFFWGPKQVVYFGSLPSEGLIDRLNVALMHVTPYIRNLVSDESLLGVMAWLMGINCIPWTVASHHFHHGSGRGADKQLIAKAHAQFAKGLWSTFRKKEFLAYYIKYKAIMLREDAKALI
jgi:hypothetical protein